MPEATKHPVSTVLVLKRNTGNILGSGSIGYVSDAYRICCMGLPKYIFRLARNPIGHVHKRALHDSFTSSTLHRPHTCAAGSAFCLVLQFVRPILQIELQRQLGRLKPLTVTVRRILYVTMYGTLSEVQDHNNYCPLWRMIPAGTVLAPTASFAMNQLLRSTGYRNVQHWHSYQYCTRYLLAVLE